jgi:hypothetical protein
MKRLRLVVILVLVLGLAALGGYLYHLHAIPPEQKIRNVMDSVREGVQTGSTGKVLSNFANDYWDGTNTKMDIRRIALQVLQSTDQYGVVIQDIQFQPIEAGATTAQARVQADVWMKTGLADTAAWHFSLDAAFVRTWRGWKITSLTGWQATVDKEVGDQGGL